MEALLPSSKISTILQSHVYPRFGRVLRALARVKSVLLDALGRTKWGLQRRRRKQHSAIGCGSSKKKKRTSRQQPAATSGGFAKRPSHLTWSGGLSPARTAAEEALDVNYQVYPCYDSAWSAVVVPAAAPGGIEGGTVAAGEYCGYLRWLEEEMPDEVMVVEEEEDDEGEEDADAAAGGGNEIDRLAEQFIARCRANFLLEKQESYDRCQEMIARSL
ncbi:hypothetical protein BDA96_04G294400 [Sorghum bicolor]|jgi:hypothetical protein|uniref:Uncharacterized protein n=2 Tax=Sorghum bicolor TaxID=4558 RepID=A0A921UJP9_SORBI|nr:uncharacterized protein LOC8073901 [Sorghum bicolor]EES07430.1 hypothetical protein SORBI_3004G276800 [Sorghum bicolor]KAG0534613.1 hypothetical protein BDA96_04G294400 [Sorghum bicolor]|eukprot:XP_002454454.1 uncharacterized protein LOC8073901 [Sorghum bicolor]